MAFAWLPWFNSCRTVRCLPLDLIPGYGGSTLGFLMREALCKSPYEVWRWCWTLCLLLIFPAPPCTHLTLRPYPAAHITRASLALHALPCYSSRPLFYWDICCFFYFFLLCLKYLLLSKTGIWSSIVAVASVHSCVWVFVATDCSPPGSSEQCASKVVPAPAALASPGTLLEYRPPAPAWTSCIRNSGWSPETAYI